mgnify:CR=1 FL=1
MSDKVIRIGSQQGFADNWNNAGAPSSLNLVDFEIPPGMIVDLSKSYIAFNTQITPAVQTLVSTPPNTGTNNKGEFATDTPINSMLRLDNLGATGECYEAPNVALIRNARISCDKGQIESIRRVDTLKSALFNMEHDREERKDDMNAFAAPKSGVLGNGNQSSYFLDTVIRNTDGAALANVITGATSRQLSRDVKVPLKSMFGIAEGAEAWDTSKFGTTRIHCETNWKHVKSQVLGGAEDVSAGFIPSGAVGTQFGAMDVVTALAGDANVRTLKSSLTYTNYQQQFPFFVGQNVLVSATITGNTTSAFVDIPFRISALMFDTATQKMDIALDPTINPTTGAGTGQAGGIFNDTAGPLNVTAITMKADNTYATDASITVNRAELVLFTKPEMSTPSEYQYVTYSTEEDAAPENLTSFARGYVMEAEAEQMIVCLAPPNHILPSSEYSSYRYAVDNEDMTGNRSVRVGSPLQYDRLTRALDNQYTDWRSAQLRFFNQTPITPTQILAYDKQNATIVDTLPLKATQKYVDLQIEKTAAIADLRIYKQMVRSIKA